MDKEKGCVNFTATGKRAHVKQSDKLSLTAIHLFTFLKSGCLDILYIPSTRDLTFAVRLGGHTLKNKYKVYKLQTHRVLRLKSQIRKSMGKPCLFLYMRCQSLLITFNYGLKIKCVIAIRICKMTKIILKHVYIKHNSVITIFKKPITQYTMLF